MKTSLSRTECVLYAGYALLGLLAWLGPHVPQMAGYHQFADQRHWHGLAHAADVLSNLPFGLLGAAGLWLLARRDARGMRGFLALFFGGLLLTCAGSSLYHLAPSDGGVFWDRLGMVPVFAGMLGLAVQSHLGSRPAWVSACLVLVAGPASLLWWLRTGQLLPWAVLQGAGMALLLVLAAAQALGHGGQGGMRWPLGAVIAWYLLAKLLEWGDAAVWQWSGQLVSGHTLKHVAAALAAWPVLAALRRRPSTAHQPKVPAQVQAQ
ncbi:MAG: hypothetical protein ACN6O3_09625 [Comamonas sp.]